MRRTWVTLGALTLAAVLGAAGVGVWLATASHTADDVTIYWRDQSPACTGAKVGHGHGVDTWVRANPGMRCTYRIAIHNNGSRTVHLDEVVAPGIGPRTGAVVTADPATSPAPAGSSLGLDATYRLDRDLRAGGTTDLDIVVVFDPGGCDDGGTAFFRNWPSVRFETLNRSFERSAHATFAFRHEGKTPGCRGLEGN